MERYFGIKLNHTNIDLRYVLQSLGYKDGLKSCETPLGIDRRNLSDIDGFCAALLCHDCQMHGNQKPLETFLV
ncbi:MAG: hypothetical protein DRH24_15545 [Deltaproteobacteria bacterium]|nr:MAG: hypothetical protein DRH24_15545 [Deltaproteobacteria bacterium]